MLKNIDFPHPTASEPYPLAPLRVGLARPGHPDADGGGVAGRSRLGVGAGSSPVYISSSSSRGRGVLRLDAGSRLDAGRIAPVPSGRFRCWPVAALLVAELPWMEPKAAWRGATGNSENKVRFFCSPHSAAARDPMEEVQAAVTAHLDQVSGLVQALSTELRSGIGPAADSLLAFVRAVDWTEPWLVCLMAFHASLLLTAVGLRRNANLQFFFLFLAYSGVYLAEKINIYLAEHWKIFASRNYFDRAGVFISVVWSGPLIFISIVTVVSSLITLCQLMVKWKRAELRHRVRLARDKEE